MMDDLSSNFRKTVETLNDLSTEHLEEARRLARIHKYRAAYYLADLVRKYNVGWAAPFIDEVLLGSADVRTWRIEDALCVADVEWTDLVTKSLDQSLSPLAQIEGEPDLRERPLMTTWEATRLCGAPGVLVRATPYWWKAPAGTRSTSVTDDLEPIANRAIAGRRWIASRVAWKWRFAKVALPATAREVASVLGLTAPLSRDGEIAVSGLIREGEIRSNEDLAPGFRGPDEWYEG
jgi:hypothetical protein